MVVWTDQGGADGSNYGVYAQRYDADNNPVGVEFRVNTTTVSSQYEPQVVGLANGGYVVVWRSDAQDGSSARFNSPSGVAAGPAGNVFVTDAYNYTVRKLTPPGSDWVVSTIAGSAGNSGADNGTNDVAFNHAL